MTPRPIVFLDLDGVLNSVDWWERRGPRPPERSHLAHNVDPAALARLNRLCQTTGAQIVFSSSWRHGWAVRTLNADFAALGCTARIIAKTPDLSRQGATRGVEIQAWLWAHPAVRDFVILDDDGDMGILTGRLVQTGVATGLTDADVDRAIALLTPEEAPDVAEGT